MKPAREKVMDLLARRGHSRRELEQKLGRLYPAHEVQDAIAHAADNNWLDDPQELAERVALELHRKLKGHLFILQYLRQKGLPAVARNEAEEQRKALEIVERKLAKTGAFDYEEKLQIHRWLQARGFEDETVRSIINY